MTAIFFYVLRHRDSQEAYKILMSTKLPFKPFEIRGKNVSTKLKQYGIDKVPTLYFPDKKAKVEGLQNIASYLGFDPRMLNHPQYQPEVRKSKKKRLKKPKLESKYQKALKDEYYEESVDEFERRYKEAIAEESEEDKREEENSSFYGSDEDDGEEGDEIYLEDEEEDYVVESDSEGESDEISLEV